MNDKWNDGTDMSALDPSKYQGKTLKLSEKNYVVFTDALNEVVEEMKKYNAVTEEVLHGVVMPIKRSYYHKPNYADGIGERKLRKRASNAIERIVSPVANKVGRNELCPCASGLKYKKCCGK